jgi:hypothetical protein
MHLMAIPFTLLEPFEKHPRTGQPKKRALKFDINALADFEQETGMGFGQLMHTKAVFATARALVWAGLKHEDRTLTVTDVGELLGAYIRDGGDINEVLSTVFKAAAAQGAFGKEAADRQSDQASDDAKPVGNAPGAVLDMVPTPPSEM